jgi:hypothetical protein
MRLLFLFLLLLPLCLQAQPSFTAADLPQALDTVYFAIDNDFPYFSAADSGAGLLWDFSDLYPQDLARNIYLDPADTPLGDTFPEANLALWIDFDTPAFSFFSQDSSQVTILGITADIPEIGGEQLIKFEDPQQVLNLPVVLGDTLRDTTTIEATIQEPTTGADLLFRSQQYSEIITDSSGDLILPSGSYAAFRQKVSTERIDSLFVIVFGTPVFIEREVSLDTNYLWISAEAKGIILNKDPDGNWLYYAPELADLQAPIAAFEVDQLMGVDSSYYFFDNSENIPFSWTWDFGDGNTSTERNPVHVYDSMGTYNVCLTVENTVGRDTLCQMVTYTVTSVENTLDPISWRVFPNPTSDLITFQYEGIAAEPYQLEIFNSLGQRLTQHFFYESTQVNTQGLAADIYFYRISSKGRLMASGRFVKK